VENERYVSTYETTREWRDAIRSKAKIKHRHHEVVGLASRHRLVKTVANINDDPFSIKVGVALKICFEPNCGQPRVFPDEWNVRLTVLLTP
jgi:hypothetical protein